MRSSSTSRPRVGLQLLGYKALILKRWADTEGRTKGPDGRLPPLPALVSLVVYYGEGRWTVPETLAETVDADDDLRPYLLDFRYTLADLGRIEDAKLSHDPALRISLLVMKWATRQGDPREILRAVVRAASALGRWWQRCSIFWASWTSRRPTCCARCWPRSCRDRRSRSC